MSEAAQLLPPSSISLICEVITGGSAYAAGEPIGIYRGGTELIRLFSECDVEFVIAGRSRTDAVRDELNRLNRDPAGHVVLTRLVEAVADPLIYRHAQAKHLDVMGALNEALSRGGLEVVMVDGRPRVRPRGTTSLVAPALATQAEALDLDTVHRDLQRALEQVDRDPEDALTAACSLLESTCRTILSRLGKPMPKERHLRPLADATRNALGLTTARAKLPPLVAEDVNQVLTGLTAAINGVAALRTHGGDAHGREAGHPRIDARIARLGINAAGTLALFLVETWQKLPGAASDTQRK